jgi:hypothetical protein
MYSFVPHLVAVTMSQPPPGNSSRLSPKSTCDGFELWFQFSPLGNKWPKRRIIFNGFQ